MDRERGKGCRRNVGVCWFCFHFSLYIKTIHSCVNVSLLHSVQKRASENSSQRLLERLKCFGGLENRHSALYFECYAILLKTTTAPDCLVSLVVCFTNGHCCHNKSIYFLVIPCCPTNSNTDIINSFCVCVCLSSFI